jgi:hypothetical protein
MTFRMTEAQVIAHQQRVGRRGPDLKKRKRGSGLPRTYPDYAIMLRAEIELAGLPLPEREFKFHETRKWRIDLAYTDRKLAIEVDGMVHRIESRFKRDIEKHQALFLAGWSLLRVSTAQVKSGEALRLVERALQNERA